MEVGGIGSSGATQQNAGASAMDKDTFMKIFVAQLRYQNPMSPEQDSQAMIAQMTQFSMLEQLYNLGHQLGSMVSTGMAGTLSSMLGKEVMYMDEDGEVQQGIAESVLFVGGIPLLKIDGVEVLPEALLGVTLKEEERNA